MRGTPTHRPAALAAAVLLASLVLASPASAHERWFVKDAPGGDWGFFFSPLPVTLAAVMVVVTVVWRWVGTRVATGGVRDEPALVRGRRRRKQQRRKQDGGREGRRTVGLCATHRAPLLLKARGGGGQAG